jgi:glycosyltransferase involved in cell wall biosynthesis
MNRETSRRRSTNPRFTHDLEIIFVEGHSNDGTWEEIQRVIAAYPQYDIKAIRQPGKGKADAVFSAFDAARGDVLMILDADLTMPLEQLAKFWQAIHSGLGEFINGSRLVYPMDDEAMRFLNLVANKVFSILFTWLLSQRFTDTLCGTKVLRRSDFMRLKAGRSYFGDFDPFGDFDLVFGAAKLSLKVVEIPIRYASRSYGETQISRFRHGCMLIRMVLFAFLKWRTCSTSISTCGIAGRSCARSMMTFTDRIGALCRSGPDDCQQHHSYSARNTARRSLQPCGAITRPSFV